MADVSLSSEELRALEQTRQRLLQLGNNIASLKTDIMQSDLLPPINSLQASAAILGNNIKTLTDHLSKHSALFSRTVAYPSTNYPGREHEAILLQLLRKKLEPPVETWVEDSRTTLEATTGTTAPLKIEDEKVWSWVDDYIGDRVAKYAMEEAGDDYTVEERESGVEHVRTGLKRTFNEDESSDDEDEDEDMVDIPVASTSTGKVNNGQTDAGSQAQKEISGTVRSMDEILRFSATGMVLSQGLGGSR